MLILIKLIKCGIFSLLPSKRENGRSAWRVAWFSKLVHHSANWKRQLNEHGRHYFLLIWLVVYNPFNNISLEQERIKTHGHLCMWLLPGLPIRKLPGVRLELMASARMGDCGVLNCAGNNFLSYKYGSMCGGIHSTARPMVNCSQLIACFRASYTCLLAGDKPSELLWVVRALLSRRIIMNWYEYSLEYFIQCTYSTYVSL